MKVAFVSLAKLGDVVNCLPMCLEYHRRGDEVFFLHEPRLSSTFLGCSYVKSVPQFRVHTKLPAVVAQAAREYDMAFNCQPFGPTYSGPFDHPHNVRAWTACGFTVEDFKDTQRYPLVFDRRDADRETFLCHSLTDKPVICLALKANSNVFKGCEQLTANIKLKWGNVFDVVDLSTTKAARFYDLLAFLDRARVLVTVDTSIMHLAAASRVPTVCLTGDDQRTAAEPRCNVVYRVAYSDWRLKLDEIHRSIASVARFPPYQNVAASR